ncbi:CcmD family protein [Phnomibacter sp. MR]|uniref:CcmD family protein n=1 Tax=Phnomibacter sp. MR TaxID=3042318 RepID=UPI003A808AE0
MAKYIKTASLFLAFFVASLVIFAQVPAENQPVEMADTMRSNGKIYVVVAVLSTVLVGIVLYLIRLEKKVKALEKEHSA